MKIVVLQNGPFMVNSFLVINEETSGGIIIDPGNDIKSLLEIIEKDKISLEGIISTHGHIDHIDGVNRIKEQQDAPFYICDLDKELVDAISVQASMFGVEDPGKISVDKQLPCQGELKISGMDITLLHTPGHSKGSVSLLIENTLFSGDTLFSMSIGRTDLPGGNYSELIHSINEKIFTLPENTRVLPGHGPETTVGNEKKMNPFFR
jgi:glyoxylase-like metal-dependent hydrolase (beta-lactamase superfamily II)